MYVNTHNWCFHDHMCRNNNHIHAIRKPWKLWDETNILPGWWPTELFRGFFFSQFPISFCLASPESCYVFGQLHSYLLLPPNCHRALLISQPCPLQHPSPNTLMQFPPFTLSPKNVTFKCIVHLTSISRHYVVTSLHTSSKPKHHLQLVWLKQNLLPIANYYQQKSLATAH